MSWKPFHFLSNLITHTRLHNSDNITTIRYIFLYVHSRLKIYSSIIIQLWKPKRVACTATTKRLWWIRSVQFQFYHGVNRWLVLIQVPINRIKIDLVGDLSMSTTNSQSFIVSITISANPIVIAVSVASMFSSVDIKWGRSFDWLTSPSRK